MTMEHKFQVNLRGVIDLLSDNLYSGPQVYLRELLQNAVDAVVARRKVDPSHTGSITMELTQSNGKNPPTLMVQDDGVGLTEEEIHQFLATIGQSSKRESLDRSDFIGQFGIGLLSGFVVSEEIVVVTRSIKPNSPTLEWRGRSDGTYKIRILDIETVPGTQVYLRAKAEKEEFFTAEYVAETAEHFGAFLPIPITVTAGKHHTKINAPPPWEVGDLKGQSLRERLLEYGHDIFETDFLDAIPLQSVAGKIQGVAFVLPFAATMTSRHKHRVYLKNMLLSEEADNLLPEWAFFVKCVVNSNELRPNAARESFYEDSRLLAARKELGNCLKAYLVRLSRENRELLDTIIACHYLPIKALAVEDNEFFRIFIDWLPFETTLGEMPFGEYRKREKDIIRYVSSRDQFRQIAGVAAAQKICIINAGYTYDTELIEKITEVYEQCEVQRIDVTELTRNFEELSLEERDATFDFLRFADVVLQPFRCTAELRRFEPKNLATLYTANDSATFLRSIEQSKEVADELWQGILDGVAESRHNAYSQLCLNYNNELVRRLSEIQNKALIRRAVEMLYVQALLLGHYPLKAQEMSVLSDGLLGLIEIGLSGSEPK